jgi:hypothetical protein
MSLVGIWRSFRKMTVGSYFRPLFRGILFRLILKAISTDNNLLTSNLNQVYVCVQTNILNEEFK